MKSNKNLILVGMMGSGKSTVGNLLSKKLGMGFIDTDKEIENLESINIKKIFETKGEAYFRNIEEELVLKNLDYSNKVISFGGGSFLNFKIRKKTQKRGISFWLDWRDSILIDRIVKNDRRPLTKNLNEIEIKNMIKKRTKFYEKANYRIDCENLSKTQIVDRIIYKYENK